jgi:hypothetical protein
MGTIVNLWKHEVHVDNIQKFSSYRQETVSPLNIPILFREMITIYLENHEKYKCNVREKYTAPLR